MTNEEKAKLFDWLCDQDSVTIELSRFMGGSSLSEVSVSGFIFGKGKTVQDAMQSAFDAHADWVKK